jgi:glycosyltransferase involved in cell wall biosynthesis
MESKKKVEPGVPETPHPLVSILMTVYNRERFIAEAIESVLASSYTHFELIIVDDMSIDRSVEIAGSYAAKDGRIRVHKNANNLGDYGNRNNAARLAKGEFMMYVDSDDLILPGGIADCVRAMLNFPDCGFGMFWNQSQEPTFVMTPEQSIRRHFFDSPFLKMGPGGTILRTSFFRAIGGYPEKYGPANDMYFNLKAACAGPTLFLPFDFMFYRLHEGQQINNTYGYMVNGYRYMKDALTELPLPLDAKEIEWIGNKNKRRFVTNITTYFFKSFDFPKTKHAVRQTGFGLHDMLKGLFH